MKSSQIPAIPTGEMLHQAIIRGNTEEVANLLKNFSELDYRDENGNNLLHVACLQKNVNREILSALLKKGVYPNSLNKANQTPLDLLCTVSRYFLKPISLKEHILILIYGGADPYHLSFKTKSILRFLLDLKKLLTTIRTCRYVSPYEYRMLYTNASFLLINEYIDQAVKFENIVTLFDVFKYYQRNPKLTAENLREKQGLIIQLIEKKLKDNKENDRFIDIAEIWELIYTLCRVGFIFSDEIQAKAKKDIEAIPQLEIFSKSYDTQGLQNFLDANPDININIKLNDGRTLLEIAYLERFSLEHCPSEEVTECAVLEAQEQKDTPKRLSPKERCDAFFEFVLLKSDVNIRDRNGQTLLHVVAASHDKPIMDIVKLLMRGACTRIVDNEQQTPFKYASEMKADIDETDPYASHKVLLLEYRIAPYCLDMGALCRLLHPAEKVEKDSLESAVENDFPESAEEVKPEHPEHKKIKETLAPYLQVFPLVQDYVTGETLLHYCIYDDKTDAALKLIQEFKLPLIEKANYYGRTALDFAVIRGNLSVVKALLNEGALFKQSIFVVACGKTDGSQYNSDVVSALLERCDTLSDSTVNLIFHSAWQERDYAVVEACCKKYPNQLKINEMAREYIHYKDIYNNSEELINILIKNGVFVNEKYRSACDIIFCRAIQCDDISRVKTLLSQDKDIVKRYLERLLKFESRLPNTLDMRFAKIISENAGDFDFSSVNGNGDTLLHIAVKSRNPDFINFFLDQGVDPNQRNKNGLSPLHETIRARSLNGVDVLLKKGADPLLNSRSLVARILDFFSFSQSNKTPLDCLDNTVSDWNTAFPHYHFSILFDSIPKFFRNFRLRYFSDRGQKHYSYLLKEMIRPEEVPYVVKKPYPELLKAIVEQAVHAESAFNLRNIFLECYTEDQLSIIKNDHALIQKIAVCIQKDEFISLEDKTHLFDKLKRISPANVTQIKNMEGSLNRSTSFILGRTGMVESSEQKEEKALSPKTLKPTFFHFKTAVNAHLMKAVAENKVDEVEKILQDHPVHNFNIKMHGRNLLDIVYSRNNQYRQDQMKRQLDEKVQPYEGMLCSDKEYDASQKIFKLLLQRLDINSRTIENKTILHLAANDAPLADILLFLLLGADVCLKDKMDKRACDYIYNPNHPVIKRSQHRSLFLTAGIAQFWDHDPTVLKEIAPSMDWTLLNELFPPSVRPLHPQDRELALSILLELAPVRESAYTLS